MSDHPDQEALQLYAEERLAAVKRPVVAAHLEACPACARLVRELALMLGELEDLAEPRLPSNFAAELAEEVAPARQLSVAPARRWLLLQSSLCCLGLILGCGVLLALDSPVANASDDLLGDMDVILGSPFQIQAAVFGALALMALAGFGLMARLLSAAPAPRVQSGTERARHNPLPRRKR